MRVEPFFNPDGSLSHYSVVEVGTNDEIIDLSTCVMHDTLESAETELRALELEEAQP